MVRVNFYLVQSQIQNATNNCSMLMNDIVNNLELEKQRTNVVLHQMQLNKLNYPFLGQKRQEPFSTQAKPEVELATNVIY